MLGMMASTPYKSVQWSNKDEVNEFVYGSPYSEASSTDSINASSTLQYINSQLVAHGFTRSSGVSFEGLSKEDSDKLSKCMLGMLSQRNEDVSRVDELSTKLRTLSYEHERLASMHRATSEQLAAAERETNLFKSRLAASNKSLQTSEAAHKATTAELQRSRSTMQSVRQTYAAELKRREKETEKMMDRWQKISDAQTKLGSIGSGIKFKTILANPVVSSRDGEIVGKGPDALEDALDEAQAARKELIEENTSLKNVLLSAANEVSRICHSISMRMAESVGGEAPHLTLSDIFSISAPESASEKFNALLTSFQQVITQSGASYEPDSTTPLGIPPISHTIIHGNEEGHHAHARELVRLQSTIVDLRRQLEQAQTQKEAGAYADQAQAIIRRFLNDDDEKATVQERQLLEKIRKELDHARKKVDEAALTLKDEKAALEEERQAFYREQRLWCSQMAIPHGDERPSKPTGLEAYFDAPAEPLELPTSPSRSLRPGKKNASPRKGIASHRPTAIPRSPARPSFAVGKVSKKLRNGTPKKPSGPLLGASTRQSRVIPPMETEVVPTVPSLPATASAQSLIVPDSFVLPPPSPLASIPPSQSKLLSKKPLPAPSFDVPDDFTDEQPNDTRDTHNPVSKRPFPVAKPLAEHMIHAYSPARPSPLSRIMMLANSPAQSFAPAKDRLLFGSVATGDEHQPSAGPSSGTVPMMLEEELGIGDESDALDDSPLRHKNLRHANKRMGATRPNPGFRGNAKGKTSLFKSSTKGTSLDTDKENGFSTMNRARRPPIPAMTKQSTTVRPLLAGKGGARRVPIGSVDAAPIGPGWK
ncbi:hypothetical protein A7U60_g5190 [Sanghuangporus baumii]|uniref:Afadin and alpha-actinin-binding-domain-containing protein n=1 Tax=Sanghuangporus baumii TaxID=108892 RepID=A0A9Q5NBN2_SANBA|nr:hypothetical protein A7U60_g5190 [Sanghuangporus baumii]